ncbi:MAG: tryptophan synthase subunit alpha [Desulfobacterales bacterium]|nr:tryptophan synthase subunit alpha [Desulfobacterales bacterium]
MTRITKVFQRLSANNGKALIPYITAGDPSLELTKKLIFQLEESGADIIELGVPFSDPMADGPTIQRASERALANSVSLKDVLYLVSEIRMNTEIPIILFGYYNPFFTYGAEKFSRDAKEAGVDGVLIVDLPPEEVDELKVYVDKAGLDIIFLTAPTSNEERIKLIYVTKVKKLTDLPVGVGFGISTPGQAGKVAKWADAVIVGSAIVKIIEDNLNSPDMVKKVGQFVKSLKDGIG